MCFVFFWCIPDFFGYGFLATSLLKLGWEMFLASDRPLIHVNSITGVNWDIYHIPALSLGNSDTPRICINWAKLG